MVVPMHPHCWRFFMWGYCAYMLEELAPHRPINGQLVAAIDHVHNAWHGTKRNPDDGNFDHNHPPHGGMFN